MKKINLILIALASLGFLSFSPAEKDVKGVWAGSYGNTENLTEIIVFLKKGNLAEVYTGNNNDRKIKGTYGLNSKDELIVSFSLPGTNVKIIMTGTMNPSGNFIAGDWEASDKESGSFYFQKQINEPSEKIISVGIVTANN